LADQEAGKRIIEMLRELSQPYGVEIRYLDRENIGVIRATDIRAASDRGADS